MLRRVDVSHPRPLLPCARAIAAARRRSRRPTVQRIAPRAPRAPPLTAHPPAAPQHVGEWYIVACPRAASPFDPAAQALPPGAHAPAMLRLAAALHRAAARHALGGGGRDGEAGGGAAAPLRLRVGIAAGPAAGVVIGAHRRFYCLYGDTVNTAARLCAASATVAADDGAADAAPVALAEAGFAAAAAASAPWARCRSRGRAHVKGKGLLETFDVAVDPAHEPGPPAPAPGGASGPSAEEGGAGEGAGGAAVATGGGLLSAEDAAWLRAPERRVGWAWATFADAGAERAFLRASAPAAARRLLVGLGLHAVAVAAQWAQCVVAAGGAGAGDAGGDAGGEWAARRAGADALLTAHAALAVAAAAAAAAGLARGARAGEDAGEWLLRGTTRYAWLKVYIYIYI
jgi:class 3 adenylate cyclase